MHAAAVTSRLRGATNSARHSTLPSLALSSTRIFPPFPSCCTAAPTASCRRRERPLVPAALFHTSRPLFAPADLPSPFAAVSSEVEPVNLADSHTDVVEESPETYQDSGRSRSDSALDLTCEASISQSAGRFNLPVTAATPGRKLPSRSQGLSSDCESMSPSSLPSAASPATTALVKTDTVTLVSPVTGAMSVISTIDAIPTCTVSLASPSSSAFRAPEAVAVARGLRASAQSSGRDGKTFPSIRKVWLLEEGKRFHDSVEAAERDIILDRPDCSSRALDFAAACGEANQALVVNPMELVMWVADTLRPTDPGIDEYLNLILFPDLDHHTFPGSEELCWSSPTRLLRIFATLFSISHWPLNAR
ncbi:hypothetical protein BCR44DRAFT_1186622 [Catenaria anguillulae PL171]|uniref:Uncharacterized protein n=1 Tax=Catenaria anguillulae PL171 TaxID=765915 RepID=A0A1Y2HJS4_9FUNG|nr:hypothetical protein BCR44DRAFT_1186622 [Catenaria anguillulae PL171]